MQLHQEPVSPDNIGFAPAGRNRKPPPTPSKFVSPIESTLDSTTTSSDDKDNGSPLPYRRFPFLDDDAAAQRIANLNQQKKSAGTSGGSRDKRQAQVDRGDSANMFKASARGGFGVRMRTNGPGQSTPLNTWRQSVQHLGSYSDRVFGFRRRVPPVVPQPADATPSHDNSEAAEVKESDPKSPEDGDDQFRGLDVSLYNESPSNDRHAKVDRGGVILEHNAGNCGLTVVDRTEEFAHTVSKFGHRTPSVVLRTADALVSPALGADGKPQEDGDAQASSEDNSEDNASAGNDQERFVIGYPHSNEATESSDQSQGSMPDPYTADVAERHHHEGAGILAVLVGFATFMLMWIPTRVGSISHRIARYFKSIWPIASCANPSVNDNTEQASGEGVAASDEASSLPSNLIASSSGNPTSSQNRADLELVNAAGDSKPFDVIDENKQESHALYVSGIVFAVASRATGGISIDQLQLILCAQYGRDASPLTEAGVDVPLKEYILRFIRSVLVHEEVDGLEMCVLKKNV